MSTHNDSSQPTYFIRVLLSLQNGIQSRSKTDSVISSENRDQEALIAGRRTTNHANMRRWPSLQVMPQVEAFEPFHKLGIRV
jgi:hypothetical protein